jgi:fatty-acyl-CoA synthase
VRVVDDMPLTANNKVHKPPLRAQRWNADRVWWKPTKGAAYRPMTDADRAELAAEFARYGRHDVL